jgi:hypothetical protein
MLLLAFIAFMLFGNILVALALAPQLVLAATGYDSAYTRAGLRVLGDPSLYVVAGFLAWLALEPLIQAVFAVAAFHAESKETGEDVRARLRAFLRAAALGMALLIVLAAPALGARNRLDPAELDQAIQQTLTAPQYSWRVASPQPETSDAWFIRFTDSIVKGLRDVVEAIGRGIAHVFRWLRGLFQRTPPARNSAPSGGEARFILYVAFALVIVVAGYLTWRGWQSIGRKDTVAHAPAQPINLALDDVTADQLPEERWRMLADECIRDGEFRLALRALHLATIAWLGADQWIAIHPGKTDHEYESEFKRRARAFPGACNLFTSNIAVFEQTWYGNRDAGVGICEAFRNRIEAIKQAVAAESVAS